MQNLKFCLFIVLALTINLGCTMSVEEAKYKVIEKENNFELRYYEPQIVAETVVNGTLENAGNKAFNILFSYISGKNKSKNKIAMTAPVSQEASPEKIEMTAPVGQQQANDGWLVSFTMPASYTIESLPEPDDARVKLRQIPAREMAAIKYSGGWSKKLYQNNLEKLNSWIAEKKYKPLPEKPIWARYNPPFTLWFLRRNEILVQVESEKQ